MSANKRMLGGIVLCAILLIAGLSMAQLEGLEGIEPPDDVAGIDCSICHGDFAQEFEFAHEPAFEGQCEMCHSGIGEEGEGHGKLLREGRNLCLECHEDKDYHYTAANCWDCHSDIHGSDTDPLLAPMRQEEYPGFFEATWGADYIGSAYCIECHSDACEQWGESAHSLSDTRDDTPVDERGCEMCHGPGGNHFGRWTAIGSFDMACASEIDTVCLKCHRDEAYVPDYQRSTHVRNEISCISCHDPHDQTEKHNLRDDPNSLCFGCHKSKRLDFAKLSHHPVDLGSPRTGLLCIECHNPHGGEGRTMLTLPKDELCASCHVEKAGPFIFSHMATDSTMGRGCETCHSPHGSNSPDMLKISGRGLCLQCHNDRVTHMGTTTCWTSGCHTELHGSNENFFFFGN